MSLCPCLSISLSLPSTLAELFPPTCIAQWGIFVQRKQRRVEQDGVVILHDDALILGFNPWFVLVCWGRFGVRDGGQECINHQLHIQ